MPSNNNNHRDDIRIEIVLMGEKLGAIEKRSKKNEDRIYTIEMKNVNYDNMQKIVYGMVALALTTLGTGIVMLLMK